MVKKKVSKKAPIKKVPAKKVAKRKVTKKKVARKIKEDEFKVAMKSDTFSTPDELDTVQGDDVEDVMADLDSDQYDKVIVTKSKGRGSKPLTAPDSAEINNKPIGLGEGFNIKKYTFPYSISLPAGFGKIMKYSLAESKGCAILESGGRITFRINNKTQLTTLMNRLHQQKDNPLAKTIIEGVIRSAS